MTARRLLPTRGKSAFMRSTLLATLVVGMAILLPPRMGATQAAVPETQCLHSEGKTACGYGCKASDNQVRCAQTPQGVCTAGSGIVACWDPPALVHAALGRRAPNPTCITSHGQTACGYHCVSNYDKVQCAQTPFGACKANEGNVVCWDPPAPVLATRGASTPVASCESGFGKVACGYRCVADHGVVRCADTPEGTCRSERGTVFCWDPPLDSTSAVWNPASELACIQASKDRSCGFRCLAIPNQGRCGALRGDSCRVEEARVVCGETSKE